MGKLRLRTCVVTMSQVTFLNCAVWPLNNTSKIFFCGPPKWLLSMLIYTKERYFPLLWLFRKIGFNHHHEQLKIGWNKHIYIKTKKRGGEVQWCVFILVDMFLSLEIKKKKTQQSKRWILSQNSNFLLRKIKLKAKYFLNIMFKKDNKTYHWITQTCGLKKYTKTTKEKGMAYINTLLTMKVIKLKIGAENIS